MIGVLDTPTGSYLGYCASCGVQRMSPRERFYRDGGTLLCERCAASACIDGPDGCRGAVALRWPGYGAKRYPRCERHGQARVDRERDNVAKYAPDGPAAPADFDPAIAGERWDDE